MAASPAQVLPVSARPILPIRFTPRERQYGGRECGGVQIAIDDWGAFEPLTLGIGLAAVLHELYPKDWEPAGLLKLLAHRATLHSSRGIVPTSTSFPV